MMRFLRDVRPDYVLSFHQPLYGVDTDNKRPGFSRHVARTLKLPATTLDCGGVCHGTMTGWFNHNFKGFALTVEYGAHPPRRLMQAGITCFVLDYRLQAQSGKPVVQQGEEDKREPGHAEQGSGDTEAANDDVLAAAASINRIHGRLVHELISRLSFPAAAT